MTNRFHSKVMQKYSNIREEEEKRLSKRRELIYNEIPELVNSDKNLADVAVKIGKLHSTNPHDWEEKLAILQEEMLNRRAEKIELMVSNRFPMDYLDHKYKCIKCQDTGFINNKKCSCYKNMLASVLYDESEFSALLDESGFDFFDEEIFDNEAKATNTGMTSRDLALEAKDISIAYTDNFDNLDENLFFFGESGTGKTFLITCIAKELILQAKTVLYKTAPRLLDDLREIKFENNKELSDMLLTCDLLIIDDLGTEMKNDLSKTEIYNLINARLLKKKKIVISSNLSISDLKDRYSERFLSRIVGDFIHIPLIGVDVRVQKGLLRKEKFKKMMEVSKGKKKLNIRRV